MSVSEIGEDALISRLVADLSQNDEVVIGPGDDCAVVKVIEEGWWQLLKTDAVVEGVHFTSLADASPQQVGWKALARVVSDMAAMGGEPQHALITLMAPKSTHVEDLEQLYAGIKTCAERFGVNVVGGETTSGPLIMLSVTLTGRVKPEHCLRRGGARPDDVILVTGRLGGSISGHHLTFIPRLEEAQWLARSGLVNAMMDLSDGLAKDVPRMAQLSGNLNWEIFTDGLPLNEGCSVAAGMGDGEDYELLMSVSKPNVKPLIQAWNLHFPGVLLSQVGRFGHPGNKKVLEKWTGGWDHFGGELSQESV